MTSAFNFPAASNSAFGGSNRVAARAGPNWATNPNDAISPSACLRFTVIEASYPERAMPPVCATAVGAAALRVSQVVKEISTPSSSICTRLKAAVMPTLPPS